MVSPGGVGGRGGAIKKKGATTLHITDFLKPEITSWADDDPENDDMPALPTAPGGGSSTYSSSPRAAAGTDLSRLPTRAPFKAFVGNLAFDATAEEVGTFFYPTFAVVDVLILKHEDTGNVRGSFVEFETHEDLKGALGRNGQMLKGRPLRIDIANDRPSDRSRGPPRGGFRDERRSGYGFDGGPAADQDGRGGGYSRRGYEDRPRGGYDDRPRGGYGERSRGGYEDRPRGGYDDRRGGYDEGRGGNPDQGGFGGDRRPRDRGVFNESTEEDMDAPRWGHKQTPPIRATSTASTDSSGLPTERKRLQLAPRSKAVTDADADPAPAAADDVKDEDRPKKANPFGEAKPVDAAAKLRELEERIEKRKAEEAAANKARVEAAAEESKAASASGAGQGAPAENTTANGSRTGGPGPEHHPPQGRGAGRGRGRGQGRGPGGREGRGREGRGREGYGRGRGPPPPRELPRSAQDAPHAADRSSRAEQGEFKEAVEKRGGRGRRGWESQGPPGMQKPQEAHAQVAPVVQQEEKPITKVTNMFDVLNADD